MHGETKRRAEKGAPANPLGRRPFLIRSADVAFYAALPYLVSFKFPFSYPFVLVLYRFSSPLVPRNLFSERV